MSNGTCELSQEVRLVDVESATTSIHDRQHRQCLMMAGKAFSLTAVFDATRFDERERSSNGGPNVVR
ncbi:MAG: hypothetical protein H0T47_23975 [Planctomycetaceae bacterium]|nr:hypothetical protein [Planctomycetaceae bacterium]